MKIATCYLELFRSITDKSKIYNIIMFFKDDVVVVSIARMNPKITNLTYGCCLVSQSCLTLLWPHDMYPSRFLCPWDSPGKTTGVDCHFLLQGIFSTQRSNLGLLHWQEGSLPLSQGLWPITTHEKSVNSPMS